MRISLLLLFMLLFGWSYAQEYKYIEPSKYLCKKIDKDFTIDGNLNKPEWGNADWTDLFVDIEGRDIKKPYYKTMAKMLWSSTYLYFAFRLEEKDIWATLTQRDAVIFHDNDIELFIDPNGDTHSYFELEINALNTVWDLFLAKPYREGGPALNGFDFAGLKTAVKLQGTINNPKDRDTSWTVEVAIPWANLIPATSYRRIPRNGENMRINFSRVQWDTDIVNGEYRKKKDPQSGKPLPENNWVWSPTGAIDMHRPENWGIVAFVDSNEKDMSKYFNRDEEELRQILMYIYRTQKEYRRNKGAYMPTLQQAGISTTLLNKFKVAMDVQKNTFQIRGSLPVGGVSYMCNTEGRLSKLQ